MHNSVDDESKQKKDDEEEAEENDNKRQNQVKIMCDDIKLGKLSE